MTGYMDKKSILVVDDDFVILLSFSEILKNHGFYVKTAATGREALKTLETESVDLILLDIQLPDVEGTKLLEQIQDIRPEARTIMVTGTGTLENATEALNFGADDFVLKPVSPGDLIDVVRQTLNR
jgi:DNA-binding NtrC family response regulator